MIGIIIVKSVITEIIEIVIIILQIVIIINKIL